jgi:hypothetical protein
LVKHRTLPYLREIGLEGMDWMHLAQDTDQWRAFLNKVMNIWVPKKARNFLTR